MKSSLSIEKKFETALSQIAEVVGTFADVVGPLADDDEEFIEEFKNKLRGPMAMVINSAVELGETNHNKDLTAQLAIARCSGVEATDSLVWDSYSSFLKQLEEASE